MIVVSDTTPLISLLYITDPLDIFSRLGQFLYEKNLYYYSPVFINKTFLRREFSFYCYTLFS